MKLSFAAHLKALRREKNLTQEQLAQKLDVSVQSVSRWETEQTYPDIELLPVIAAFFETTVDRLIGAESAALEEKRDAYIDQWNRTPGWQERHKLLLKAHHDFPRDMHISTLLCDSYTYPDNMKTESDALEKARMLALDVLETTARKPDPDNWWYREGVIRCMVNAEPDDKVEEWLDKYATHQDMRRDALLLGRYGIRHEEEKRKLLSQRMGVQRLYLVLDSFAYGPDVPARIRNHETMLRILDMLTGTEGENPVSGDGVPDMWTEKRLNIAFKLAGWYSIHGETDRALDILEEAADLLDAFCALPDETVLTYRCPQFDALRYRITSWHGKQPWVDENYGKQKYLIKNMVWDNDLLKDMEMPEVLFVILSHYSLTQKDGFSCYDPIRNTLRYRALVDRLYTLAEPVPAE